MFPNGFETLLVVNELVSVGLQCLRLLLIFFFWGGGGGGGDEGILYALNFILRVSYK